MKAAAIILYLSLPFSVFAWVQNSRVSNSRAFIVRNQSTRLLVTNGADLSTDSEMTDKPCWQDIWSYDCAMSTAYSASFVPAEWIRKLPCALGLAVSFLHEIFFNRQIFALSTWIHLIQSIFLYISFLKIIKN